MTPDNPQERLKALIEEMRADAMHDLNIVGPNARMLVSVVDAIVLLDAASRSIPAGEDAELVDRLRGWLATSSPERHDAIAAELPSLLARLSSLSSELEQVRARLEKAAKLNRRVLTWAEQRCPCRNDEPNPCPLCGASVENLEPCKSAENTIPPDILGDLRAAGRWIEGGE